MIPYRAIVVDATEGLVVIDLDADSEADAKGIAHNAAVTHLNCKAIKNVIVRTLEQVESEAWARKVMTQTLH